jgi:hypothetical protein
MSRRGTSGSWMDRTSNQHTPFAQAKRMPNAESRKPTGSRTAVSSLASQHDNLSPQGPPRARLLAQAAEMRPPTACFECRQAKRRCSRPAAGDICAPCQRKRLVCRAETSQDRSHRVKDTGVSITEPSPPIVEGLVLSAPHPGDALRQGLARPLSRGTAIELVEQYIFKFDGRPHSLFHGPTLRWQVRNNSLSPVVLYAICAITSRFSGNPDVRALKDDFRAEAKRLLQSNITDVCLENIQACLLVAMLGVGTGERAEEALFFREPTVDLCHGSALTEKPRNCTDDG